MRILLIRHAQSSGQEPGADLTAEGHAQARLLVPRLTGLGVCEIFSSPYRRAVATVAPFAGGAGVEIHELESLRERKLAEGWRPDFLDHMERSFVDETYRLDGGESLAQTAARGLDALAQIARAARSTMPAATSHGNLIASILRTMDPSFGFDAWKAMGNPHLYQIDIAEGRPVAFKALALN